MLHPQGRAFKGGGGNPTAFPQKKRCNLKKELLPSTQVLSAVRCRCKGGAQPGRTTGVAVCKLPLPGFVGTFCGGVLIFRSRRLRFFFTCLFEKRIPPPTPSEP